METDARLDFRWKNIDGSEVEAVQITKGMRWATHLWPAWLQVQKSGMEVNRVYTDNAAQQSLFIKLDSGEYQIEDDAYVIHEGGILTVQNGTVFEAQFDKVVPVPPRDMDPESLADFEKTHRMDDGKLVSLLPEEIEENNDNARPVEGLDPRLSTVTMLQQESVLRPKAEIAFEALKDGNADVAEDVLKRALSEETIWCSCSPGQCEKIDRWGCRQFSPLVT